MGIHGSNLTEEQLETHTIAVWRETQECRTDSNGRTYPQHMVHALLLGRDARFSCRLRNGPRCHVFEV
ncbi:hypothetical protein JHK87_028172 [Glycine soja]|nr:hypothetical protein JHK87_028172 [Glycine soja]